MKKIHIVSIFISLVLAITLLNSCSSTRMATITGAQLWGENCVRCHNAPPSTDFSDREWEAVGTHMRLTGHLSKEERDKIVEFLKSSN